MNSFICWIGGKKLLRKEIIKNFPKDFDRYIEVFGGAGWVLFGKEQNGGLEVFNDIDGELINLFRCVKYHPEAVQKELDYMLVSREQFFEMRNRSTEGLTDIQKAARYFYLIRVSFGANKEDFCTNSKNLRNAAEYLTAAAERLKRVVIENKDFENLISVYDRTGALFYCDPPYYNAEKYYTSGRFGIEQHNKLRDIVANIKGKFILSYNDCDFVRELYKDFNITEVERNNSLKTKSGGGSRYNELIIKNY